MKLVQITTSVNWGAVGRIAEQIGNHVIKDGGESYIFYGRYCNKSESIAIKCTNLLSIAINLFCSRLFDMEGLSSWYNTKKVIRTIDKIKPDVIHIHNLHGYYFNYSVLFKYLNKIDTPVVWTFHDCWSFTGHCSHFVSVNCTKWKNECGHCPLLRSYPKSILFDGSKRNYKIKKKLFTDNKNLHVVAVSEWMAGLAHQSFFQGKDIRVINNGVDLNVFKPLGKIFQDQFKVLGVASVWSEKKGLSDFIRLREILDKSIFEIILVGLSQDQIKKLPLGIKGLERTESLHQLAELYSSSDVFVNLTYEDTFPTVNIEALACGTPVITYNTGGSPEAIDEHTGLVIGQGDIEGVAKAIESMCFSAPLVKEKRKEFCRKRAERLFEKDECFKKYIQLYNSLRGE